MRLIEQVKLQVCHDHLKRLGTGVRLDFASMPKPTEGYFIYRALLEDSDVHRIFLWFEFKKHTRNLTAKLTNVAPESADHVRVSRIIMSDATRNLGPIDLRRDSGFEPVLLTNDTQGGMLYGIDGNHRMIAQFLSHRDFGGVSVYVCTHPNMLEWPYITDAAKEWHKSS